MSARAPSSALPAGPADPAWQQPAGPAAPGPRPPRRAVTARTNRQARMRLRRSPRAVSSRNGSQRQPGGQDHRHHRRTRASGLTGRPPPGCSWKWRWGGPPWALPVAPTRASWPGLDLLAQVDQVVLVVGVVVGGAAASRSHKLIPPRPRSRLLRRLMLPLATRDQGCRRGRVGRCPRGGGDPVAGAPQLARSAPALDRHTPPAQPRVDVEAARWLGWPGGAGRPGPQPAQLGGGQHGQDRHHHQHRQPTTRGGTARHRPGRSRPPSAGAEPPRRLRLGPGGRRCPGTADSADRPSPGS